MGNLKLTGSGIDRAHLERWAPVLGVRDLLDRAVAESMPEKE